MKGTSPSRVIRAIAGYGIEAPRWEVRSLINSLVLWKGKAMSIVTVGIDLAKNVFAVHGVDAAGKVVLVRPTVPRAKLLELIAALPPCLIGMEECSGAHHWARAFQQFGHTVRLMAPKFVTPYSRMKSRKSWAPVRSQPFAAAANCSFCGSSTRKVIVTWFMAPLVVLHRRYLAALEVDGLGSRAGGRLKKTQGRTWVFSNSGPVARQA